jgi:chromosome segregation ATPase
MPTAGRLAAMSDKKAAIRKIMRERQQNTAPKTSPMPKDSSGDDENRHVNGSLRTANVPMVISRAVTLDNDNCFTEGIERFDLSGGSDESLSSSCWMLMEHGFDNCAETSSASPLCLLDRTTFLSEQIVERTMSSCSIQSPCRIADEADLNVSWNDNDAPNRDNRRKLDDADLGDTDERFAQSIFHQPSLSPASDDVMSDAVKSPRSGSPFTTFRQNSTNIALEETKVYALRIQALEQELVNAQQHVADEVERRVALELKERYLAIAKTPAKTPRTPRLPRTFSGTDLSRSSPWSTCTVPESLWERNKTLVTEVRFADQTCVELASQKASLEKELLQLRNDYAALCSTNQSLQDRVTEVTCSSARAEVEIDTLRQKLVLNRSSDQSSLNRCQALESEVSKYQRRLSDCESTMAMLRRENALLSQQLQCCSRKASEKNLQREKKSHEHPPENDLGEILHSLEHLRDVLVDKFESSHQLTKGLDEKILSLQSKLAGNVEDTCQPESCKQTGQAGAFRRDIVSAVVPIVDTSSLADKIGFALVELEAYSMELADEVFDRVSQLEQRLLSCIEAMASIKNVFPCDRKSKGDAAIDIDASQISERYLDATFSRKSSSVDLDMMEEARSIGANEGGPMNQQMRSGSNNEASDCGESSRSELAENQVGAEDASELSSSLSSSPDQTLSNAQFHHHLQWMASPSSTLGYTGAPTDDECVTGEYRNNRSSDTNHAIAEINCVRRDSARTFGDGKSNRGSSCFNGCEIYPGPQGCDETIYLSRNDSAEQRTSPETHDDYLVHNRVRTKPSECMDATSVNASRIEHGLSRDQEAAYPLESMNRSTLQAHIESLHRTEKEAEAKLREKRIFPRKRENESDAVNIRAEPKPSRQEASQELRSKGVMKIEELELMLTTVEKERATLMGDLNTCRIKCDDIQKERDCLKELNLSILQRVDGARDTVTGDLSAWRMKCDAITKERDRLRDLNFEYVATIEKMQEASSCLNTELISAKSSVCDLQSELQQLNDSHGRLLEQFETCQNDLLKERDTSSRSETRHRQTTEKVNKMYLEATKNRDALIIDRDALLKKVAVLTNELHLVNERLRSTTSDLIDRDEAVNKAEVLRRKSDALAARNHEKLSSLLEELEQARGEIEAVEEAKQTLESLSNELSACRDQVSSLESQLHDTTALVQLGKDEESRLLTINDLMASKCHRLKSYIRKLTEKCDEWEAFQEREERLVLHLKSAFDNARSDIVHLTSACENHEHVSHCSRSTDQRTTTNGKSHPSGYFTSAQDVLRRAGEGTTVGEGTSALAERVRRHREGAVNFFRGSSLNHPKANQN